MITMNGELLPGEAERVCVVCHRGIAPDPTREPGEQPMSEAERSACSFCREAYGPVLIKAHVDIFDYACGLLDGTEIKFGSACLQGSWVHLTRIRSVMWPLHGIRNPRPFPRGLQVLITAIAWVADAPDGMATRELLPNRPYIGAEETSE